jgi:hypothetical protein
MVVLGIVPHKTFTMSLIESNGHLVSAPDGVCPFLIAWSRRTRDCRCRRQSCILFLEWAHSLEFQAGLPLLC